MGLGSWVPRETGEPAVAPTPGPSPRSSLAPQARQSQSERGGWVLPGVVERGEGGRGASWVPRQEKEKKSGKSSCVTVLTPLPSWRGDVVKPLRFSLDECRSRGLRSGAGCGELALGVLCSEGSVGRPEPVRWLCVELRGPPCVAILALRVCAPR